MRNKKPTGVRGNWIDNDNYERIWDAVCDWFDENIDRFVRNIQQVYALTGNQVGFSALKADWDFLRTWKGVGDIERFSAEDIRNNIIEKIYTPMCRLWLHNDYGQTTPFSDGFTGLLVTFNINVNKGDENDEFRWTYTFNLSLNIGSGGHGAL